MITEFEHIQSAHCENGVTSSLLQFHGLDFMSEPLAFGMGSGIFYIHVPFLKINNGPAVSYRSMPGWIFNRTCKSLGVRVQRKKFKSEADGQAFLDKKLEEGQPVGCQVGVFHLPYFPPEYRFHFNAHNIIVYGKENGQYLISDPVMETETTLTPEELNKVRYARGPLAPNGQVYFPEKVEPVNEELIKKAIIRGIKGSVRDMLMLPGSFVGISGIKYTARKIRKWRGQLGAKRAGLYLGQVVRMQEEIGTGGGGFRYLFAAFLEESARILGNDDLIKASEDFTKAGDRWRDSAVEMAGIYKGRLTEQKDFDRCADTLMEIANIEKEGFQKLKKTHI
ncbi:MAG: BtrH N-terminal domain-containing protein [Flavobacteriales bacterium]